MGDPINNADRSGLFVDVLVDVGSIGYDLYRLIKDNVVGDCDNFSTNMLALSGDILAAVVPGVTGVGVGIRAAKVARAGKKVPVPTLKSSPFGPKIADEIPTNGVPRNWSRDKIEDAIVDYAASIASRKRELNAFDAVGGGSATQRLAHAQRITQEESFLKSLQKALGR